MVKLIIKLNLEFVLQQILLLLVDDTNTTTKAITDTNTETDTEIKTANNIEIVMYTDIKLIYMLIELFKMN